MNKITKAERERLYQRAAELLQQDFAGDEVSRILQSEKISKQRADHAVAKVRTRRRKR